MKSPNHLINSSTCFPIDWTQGTYIMGIINITPDSFSDGGEFFNFEIALAQVKAMIQGGAHIIDLGSQSTRPWAEEVGPVVERERLIPILKTIRQEYPEILVSVDTFHSEVAEAALIAGANWINDISGGRRDSNLLKLIGSKGCPYIITHSRGHSRNMNGLASYRNIGVEVRQELLMATEKAMLSGIQSNQIIWDPGLGFAKSTSQVIALLHSLVSLKAEGFPLLIGPSRKRFIGEIINESNPKARIWGTIAVVSHAISLGINIIRVHDVEPVAKFVNMSNVLWRTMA